MPRTFSTNIQDDSALARASAPRMLDDGRLHLPFDNVFQYLADCGTPAIAADVAAPRMLRTAAEIEAERLRRKQI
jgi:hypothetical protein